MLDRVKGFLEEAGKDSEEEFGSAAEETQTQMDDGMASLEDDFFSCEDEDKEANGDDEMFKDCVENSGEPSPLVPKRKKRPRHPPVPVPEEIANLPHIKKYWSQRYRLFSKFDEGNIILVKGLVVYRRCALTFGR